MRSLLLYLSAAFMAMAATVVKPAYTIDVEGNVVDMTIVAQTPKLAAFKADMRGRIAALLQIPSHRVNIKATTSEKLGFIGREEGVTVHAVANLTYYPWKEKL
jgi:2-C-methyl-D-erythritol 4-phosphate cytidylyltransferase/2-C-methyl-D-erythritol 2,4-cyclodiphosphate synthase